MNPTLKTWIKRTLGIVSIVLCLFGLPFILAPENTFIVNLCIGFEVVAIMVFCVLFSWFLSWCFDKK